MGRVFIQCLLWLRRNISRITFLLVLLLSLSSELSLLSLSVMLIARTERDCTFDWSLGSGPEWQSVVIPSIWVMHSIHWIITPYNRSYWISAFEIWEKRNSFRKPAYSDRGSARFARTRYIDKVQGQPTLKIAIKFWAKHRHRREDPTLTDTEEDLEL